MSERIIVLDEGKMLAKIEELPAHLETAWTTNWIKDIHLPENIGSIVIAGMGGSGIAGRLAAELFAHEKIQILPWADYGLPTWANESTLLIAVSYSGETEETISAVKAAIERKIPVVVITSGGTLKQLAEQHHLTVVTISYQSPPRAALGALYGSLLVVLTKTKKVSFKEGDLFRSIEELRAAITKKLLAPKIEELAMSLSNKLPLVLAAAPLTAVARRLVNQFNENSKTTVIYAELPELCHNLINGLDFAVPEKITALMLESSYSFSRNIARGKAIAKIFDDKQIAFIPLSMRSSSQLSEQLLFVHFSDLLSFYLAGVNAVDPTPVPEIATLKSELTKI